jgi:hypothetical protein
MQIGVKENDGWVEYVYHNIDGSQLHIPLSETKDINYHLDEDAQITTFDGKVLYSRKGEIVNIQKGNYVYIIYKHS